MRQENCAAQGGCCGRTSPEPFQQTAGETLLPWLDQWLAEIYRHRKVGGKKPELVSDETDSSSGACLTLNMSEFNHIPERSRSDVAVCSLSSILETGAVDRRYFLSQKACAGILRRAEKRGKTLPQHLRRALAEVACSEPTSTVMES